MFVEYTLNTQNQIPTKKLLERLAAARVEKTKASRSVNSKSYENNEPDQNRNPGYSRMASYAYESIEQIDQDKQVLHAQQIMTSPVICLNTEMNIAKVLEFFKHHKHRHMPVLSLEGSLAGIVSDRDILQFLSGLSGTYEQQSPHNTAGVISQIMSSPVLSASVDTDVRYIARLFVEQHVGAMPIMLEGRLTGIISRTDIMRAVMQNFVLELWT